MDRGTRRLFAGALGALVVVVGVVTLLLAAPGTTPPSDTTAVEGVIVGVDSQSLSEVTSFDLRVHDGSVRRFLSCDQRHH